MTIQTPTRTYRAPTLFAAILLWAAEATLRERVALFRAGKVQFYDTN